jgi:hypothetical protein
MLQGVVISLAEKVKAIRTPRGHRDIGMQPAAKVDGTLPLLAVVLLLVEVIVTAAEEDVDLVWRS